MDEAPEWNRTVFEAGARAVTIRDVLRTAHFCGELDGIWEEHCRFGDPEGPEADPEAVQSRSEDFRSERDLITAEETEQWLEQRGLTLEDFSEYFARQLVRETSGGGPERPAMKYGEAPDHWHDLLRIDLLLNGEFDRLAERLAWRFVARDGAAPAVAPTVEALDWVEEIRSLESAFQAQSALLLTPHARADALQTLRLSLTRFELEVLELESADAAREALCCLRDDGESMEDVARDGSYLLRRREVTTGELAPAVQSPLLSAALGDVLGPFANGEEFLLYRLERKIEPELVDEAVRERIDQYLVARYFSAQAPKLIHWRFAAPYAPAT